MSDVDALPIEDLAVPNDTRRDPHVAVLNGASRDRHVAALSAEVAGLQRAMETRAVIEQAKGMLVERLGCTPDEAFQVLAMQSQQENRKLRDIAAEQVRLIPVASNGNDARR